MRPKLRIVPRPVAPENPDDVSMPRRQQRITPISTEQLEAELYYDAIWRGAQACRVAADYLTRRLDHASAPMTRRNIRRQVRLLLLHYDRLDALAEQVSTRQPRPRPSTLGQDPEGPNAALRRARWLVMSAHEMTQPRRIYQINREGQVETWPSLATCVRGSDIGVLEAAKRQLETFCRHYRITEERR